MNSSRVLGAGSRGQLDINSAKIKEVLSRLQITTVKVEDWIILQRSRFDITVGGEPYSALQLYFNFQNSEYLTRVWGKTHSKGTINKSVTAFELLCNQIFGEGLACCPGQIGNGAAESLASVNYPFQRRVSLDCAIFYIPQGPDYDHQPINMCSKCTSDPSLLLMSSDTKAKDEIKEEASDPLTCDPEVKMMETTMRDTEDLNEVHSRHENVPSFQPRQRRKRMSKVGVKYVSILKVQVKNEKLVAIVGEDKNKENAKGKAPNNPNKILPKQLEESKNDCEHCGISLARDGKNISLDLHYDECSVAREKARQQVMDLIMSEPKEPKRVIKEASAVVCDICGKEMMQNKLKGHMLLHTNPLRCSYIRCATSLPTREARRLHITSVHLRIPHFTCEICGKVCKGKTSFSNHVQVVHKRMSLDIKCRECEKVFINKSAMLGHRNIVHFPDKYKCHDCKKSFGYPGQLQRHKVVHSGEKNFQCEECGRKFKKKECLTDHKRTHTGEKPFACQHCPYRGTSSSLLAHHKKQKHKAIFEEERKQKEKAKIKVSDNMISGNNVGEPTSK